VDDPKEATPTSVFLTRQIREQLEERAKAEERSLSGEIRFALKHHLETHQAKP
jgi:hypothetical protein